jgi:SNF2 family DNA or RNA helicase
LEAELVAFARARDGRTVLTVDESFYVKNLDTRRTQAVRRLREWCGRTYVLCGTPAPNSAHDLVQQMDLVDFGGTFGGVEVPDARGAANIVVQRALADRGLYVRHLKRDVLPGLPGKSFESVLVPLQPRQLGLYEEAQRTLIRDLQDTDNASFQFQITSFLARRLALLQICSHPGALARGYTEIPAKLLALDAILEELIERRAEKVVVWSYFRYSLERIVGRYARYGAVRYDGSVSSVDERRDVVRRFQEDASTRLFVGNPAAAGAGLTLHRARIAVYESMSDQAAQYLQSLDRIHRRGQDRQVEYILLLADGTIEGHEYGRLLEKQGRAEALLGDRAEPPPTRERMLGELGVRAAR